MLDDDWPLMFLLKALGLLPPFLYCGLGLSLSSPLKYINDPLRSISM